MKLALYIGDHTKDDPTVRLGWWLTRLVQKGQFSTVTHVEAILQENADGTVNIASSSLREGGVRIKENTRLTPGHWIIVETGYSTETAFHWFKDHLGQQYDALGAFATCMPFQWSQKNRWFCNQAVGAAIGLKSPETFGPSQFAAFALTIGNDVTAKFFGSRP